MGSVTALANREGGVGKTTTSVNLDVCSAEIGQRVLLIDLDPQGNVTSGLGVEKQDIKQSIYDVLTNEALLEDVIQKISHEGVDIAPTTTVLSEAEVELTNLMTREARLKDPLGEIRQKYDFILIGYPPSLGLLTINAFTACDLTLIPVQSEYHVLEGLSQPLNTIKLVRKHFNPQLKIEGVLLTMFDRHTNLRQQVNSEVKKSFGDRVYDMIIPRNARLSEAPSHGLATIDYDKNSTGTHVYQRLAKEMLADYGKE